MTLNIHFSGPKMVKNSKSIAEMFMTQLNNNNGLFGIDCSTDTEYSYPKLKKDVFAMASKLQNENFGVGDIVMSTDYGTYEGQVVILAGLLIGATIAPLNYSLKKEILYELVEETKPDVIFCSASSINSISDVLINIKHQPKMKISTTRYDGFYSYSNIVTSSEHLFARPTISKKCNKFPCAIVYSSGTTGIPKAVYLSDDALKYAAAAFMTLMEEPIENRLMMTLPVFWYTGILLMLLSVHYGKPRLFFSTAPSYEQMLRSIEKFKPTFLMTGVAAVNEMMNVQMANNHKYNIESLVTLVVGGSPMRAELQKTITENLLRNRIPIKQGYGATEQGILALWSMDSDIDTVKKGSVGRPAPGIKFKIVNLKTGRCEGPNVIGEIRIKSEASMIGYAYDMKKTINSYDEDGWFKSGDVGRITEDGCLYIVGRIKEMMIYKDNRLSPVDVETVLLSHPAVQDAGVTSRDSVDGDLLIGIVKVKTGQNVDSNQLISYVNGKVEDYEKLRGGIIFVDDVPRSPAGKLKREELKLLVK